MVLVPATVANPYGIRLHELILSFLRDTYVSDHMAEFESPSLHDPRGMIFAVFVLAVVLVFARQRVRLVTDSVGRECRRAIRTPVDGLTAIYAAMSGFYSYRNVPLATIFLSFAVAPHARAALARVPLPRLRALAAFGDDAARDELRTRRVPVWQWATVAAAAIFLGRIKGAYHFDAEVLPVRAASFIAAHDIHDGLFAPDQWGCYLTYRLFPSLTVLVDDRFELAGKEAMQLAQDLEAGNRDWRARVRELSLTRILLPPKWGMATVLREASDWSIEYEDETSVLFVARAPAQPHSTNP